jgi:hypothetical protein
MFLRKININRHDVFETLLIVCLSLTYPNFQYRGITRNNAGEVASRGGDGECIELPDKYDTHKKDGIKCYAIYSVCGVAKKGGSLGYCE